MQRNMELCRKILFQMEASERGMAPHIAVEGFTAEEVGYHVWLLADAGLIKAREVTHMQSNSRCALPISLNSAGHDFIDAARSDNVWSKAKEKIKASGVEVPLAIMKQVLLAITKTELAKHGVHLP